MAVKSYSVRISGRLLERIDRILARWKRQGLGCTRAQAIRSVLWIGATTPSARNLGRLKP